MTESVNLKSALAHPGPDLLSLPIDYDENAKLSARLGRLEVREGRAAQRSHVSANSGVESSHLADNEHETIRLNDRSSVTQRARPEGLSWSAPGLDLQRI